ncbi:MAG: HypC/HybG/HupF family hydrogenase formation chaperone [Thiothrix sp.]|nr:MAG: HypC/HybG/HupF family hydrogenase formation chaperone [Thiothrix sp.]
MCLAIPMQIIAIEPHGLSARCIAQTQEREVGLVMLAEIVQVGDYVMVSLGQALQKISAEEAKLTWSYYEEILQLNKH